MDVSPDYEDLFKILNTHGIKYLVVGAHAVIHYTEPRYTKDIDVWIIPEMNSPHKIFSALKDFGAPLIDMIPKDFENKSMILQIGVAPIRIDILLHVPGVTFQTAWKNRKKTKYGKTPIHILSLEDVTKTKKKAARPQDLLDLQKLKNIQKRLKKRNPSTTNTTS